MSEKNRTALWAWCGLIGVIALQGRADAGLLDRWLFAKPSAAVRSQSPDIDEECRSVAFCEDCDHNPRPRCTEWCRRHICHGTYYPSIPPFCAPCWGVYPTCWRRADDCWVCPQVQYSVKRKHPQGRISDIPPAPPARTFETELPPMSEPVETPEPPALPEDEVDVDEEATTPDSAASRSRVPAGAFADARRQTAGRSQSTPRAAAANGAPRASRVQQTQGSQQSAPPRARSIEQLLEDLQ